MCMLAKSFHGAGFVVVLDDFATRFADVVRYVECLQRPLGLVLFAPPIEVIAARDAGRHKQVFDAWKHKDTELRAELSGHRVWIEDPELTPEQIASEVLGNVDSASVTS